MTGRPQRVLHVFATFGAGGPQIRALQLMARWGGGVEHLVLPMDGCDAARAQCPAGVNLQVLTVRRRRGFFRTVRRLRRLLAELQPDLVLTYNWGSIAAVAAAHGRAPLVHHEDGFRPDEVDRRLRRRNWLRRWLLSRTEVLVPSARLQQIAVREWGLRQVRHVPNGVDVARFHPALAPVRAVPVIGTVGGLRAEKDHATLLRACARLPVPFELQIAGGGAERAALEALAAALGLEGRVRWLGAIDDTAPCYRGFDVFALSSRTEQMPLALLEAMASGLPVVCTDVGDVREMLPPECRAAIVPPGDPAALAAALTARLQDPALRTREGTQNRSRAAATYRLEQCLDRFLDVYRTVIGSR